MSPNPPLFPGGVAVSGLQVYDWDAADGPHAPSTHRQGAEWSLRPCGPGRGGAPHLHTASSEGYVVTGGAGEVHTVSAAGRAVHRLEPGEVVWFSPGTVHRLVNHGDLELVVIMQNAGLPEAGDAVLTFPAEVLDDPEAYAAAAGLPASATDEERADAARARRDLALRGHRELLDDLDARGPAALAALHRRAARLVRPKVEQWRRLWAATVEAETARTRAQLEHLAAGDPGLLSGAAVTRGERVPGPRLYGMCGRLQTWAWPLPADD